MCITQVWTYRECGCHYYHPVLCHPSFAPTATTSGRLRAGPHPSNVSTSAERPPKSTISSILSGNDPLTVLCRQCSIGHIIHRNFLEPICDECLLKELGLQPELGPILGGRDLKEGLRGEEWLLESNVEINIEDANENLIPSTDRKEEDDNATDADDEGDSPWRSERRRGIDISRDVVRISSDLSAQEHDSQALFREELHDAEPRGRRRARAATGVHNEERRLKHRWSLQLRKGLARIGKDDQQRMSISPAKNRSAEFSQVTAEDLPLKDHDLVVENSSPETHVQLPPGSPPEDVRDILSDTPEQIISLYETDTKQDNEQDMLYSTWLEHLRADLEKRHSIRDYPAASMVDPVTPKQRPQSPSSLPSSPQTASTFNSASWPLTYVRPLNIASSEFDRDEMTFPPALQPYDGHSHTTSVTSTLSTSTFCTAPSSPIETPATAPASSPSTRPTTANSATTRLSFHPLSTTFSTNTPYRPSLTSRTSSLHSPPASSPLLHSTPPLHQSPTSAFVCIHERWAFRKCGCEGPSSVKSCVCDDNTEHREGEEDRQSDADPKDLCRATSPVVRTRWFFNSTCEACLGGDVVT